MSETTPCPHAARPPIKAAADEHNEALLARARRSDVRRRGDCERIAASYRDASVKDVLDTASLMGRIARLKFWRDH